MPDRRLIVMLKAPVAGRVKTRLGHEIGTVPATWWFRHQVAHLLRRIESPRWHTVLAVTPDAARFPRFRPAPWPAHLPRLPQGRGDIGTRMARLLRRPHPGPVCLVGADIPQLTAHHINRAFQALGNAEIVFGPASDGGFWLAGLRHPRLAPKGLFENVRWSSRHTLSDSLRTLGHRSHTLIDRLSDVDRAADL